MPTHELLRVLLNEVYQQYADASIVRRPLVRKSRAYATSSRLYSPKLWNPVVARLQSDCNKICEVRPPDPLISDLQCRTLSPVKLNSLQFHFFVQPLLQLVCK
jgi:hypothetical protein